MAITPKPSGVAASKFWLPTAAGLDGSEPSSAYRSVVAYLYLLFFIHVGTRRVLVSSPTASPDAAWVAQEARNATVDMADLGLGATHLLIDHDAKQACGFDSQGTALMLGPPGPPT